MNELSISIDKNIVWKKIASSTEKINGPIYWPIKPIKTKDKYKLLLRPQGSPFGSNLVINLETEIIEATLEDFKKVNDEIN